MRRTWRSLKLGLKSLLLHKLRSGLTILGIVFGVAAVIVMMAVSEGKSRDAQEQIEKLGATNIIYRSVKPSDEAQASSARVSRVLNYGLKYSDYDRIVETVPNIQKILPLREIRKEIRRLNYSMDGRVVGTTADYLEFNRLEVDRGPLPLRRRRRRHPELRRPGRRDLPRPSSPTRTRSASRSRSATTTTPSSA